MRAPGSWNGRHRGDRRLGTLVAVSFSLAGGGGALGQAQFFDEPPAPAGLIADLPARLGLGKAPVLAGDGPRKLEPASRDTGGIAGPGPMPLPAMYVGDGAGAALAINSGNPDNLVGLHNTSWLGITGFGTSSDGNLSWNPRAFPAGSGTYNLYAFHPWGVAGNSAGTLYGLFEWSDSASSNSHAVIARSLDNGVTWAPFFERLIDVGQDRAMVDIDRTTALGGGSGATHNNKLYLCYDNHGVNFSGYVGSYLQIVSSAGAPLSELAVSTAGASFRGSQMQPVSGVNDGQVYLLAHATAANGATRILRFHEVSGGGAGLTLDKSSMSFASTGQQLGAGPIFGVNGHRVNAAMFMDIDRTNGPRRGALYVISDRNPNPADPTLDQGDVYLSVSTNGASSWTSSLLPTPDIGRTQYFSMLDVDANGWLHVAYYQNDSGVLNGGALEAGEANVYYTVSFDGGLVWSTPIRINDPAHSLQLSEPPPNLAASNYYLVGDYQQIQATGTGAGTTAYILWTSYDRNRSGAGVGDTRERVVCTRILNVCSPPAGPPSGVAASDATACDRVTVTWSPAPGASHYEIWRHTSSNSAGATMIGTSFGASFDDTTAVAGTFYYYWVKSSSGCAASGFSNSDSGRRAALTISPHPEPTSAPPGGGARFWIHASGVAPLTYQWRFNGTPINPAGNPSAATAILTLANVGPANVGTYDCVVSDPCRSVTSNAATLSLCSTAPCAGNWATIGAGVNQVVTAIVALPNGDAIVGGGFTSAGGVPSSNIARCNPDSGAWTALGSGVNNFVRTLDVFPNGDVLVGGDFSVAGGATANRIARYSPVSNTWSALGTGLNWTIAPGSTRVHATVVIAGGDVIAGGYFNMAGGVAVNSIARYNPTTNTWSALGAGVNGFVHALAVLPGGEVAVGGTFTLAGGQSANNVARYNPTTNAWSPLGTGLTAFGQPTAAFAQTLASDANGDILVGGSFDAAGGVSAASVARFSPAGNTWSSLGSGVSGLNQTIDAVAVRPNGDVIVGGFFSMAGGAPAGRIARFVTATQTWSPLCGGADAQVYALAVRPEGDVLIGGSFTLAGGYAAQHIARWTICGRGDVSCDGAIDFFDIDPFLLALFDAPGYASAYPDCDRSTADIDLSGGVDFFDIDPFLLCLFSGVCP